MRTELVLEARNRAALQALESFYQLADAEGRGELIRETLPVLDRLRAVAAKARAEGVRLPVELDALDRQRASLLGLLVQADLGARVFDLELKRRIGYPGRTEERLRPLGPFAVKELPIDRDAAVQVALERRAELRLLRTLYWRATPDTLDPVREYLRTQSGTAALLVSPAGRPTLVQRTALARFFDREAAAQEAAARTELALRRQQLFELILERERQAADDVRAAVAALQAQTRLVGLARWRVEQARQEVAESAGQGPLVTLPAELEALQARADQVAAVMAWHLARVRLLAAQGLLADYPAPPGGHEGALQ